MAARADGQGHGVRAGAGQLDSVVMTVAGIAPACSIAVSTSALIVAVGVAGPAPPARKGPLVLGCGKQGPSGPGHRSTSLAGCSELECGDLCRRPARMPDPGR